MTSVRVVSDGSRFGQAITIRQFQMTADEPPSVGGDDAGPTPMEYILAGLGSCKAMTLQMYAERKGWPLEQVTVELSYEAHQGEYRMEAQLMLKGDLDDAQRQRLREISDRCPVHKMLTAPVQIQTALVAATATD